MSMNIPKRKLGGVGGGYVTESLPNSLFQQIKLAKFPLCILFQTNSNMQSQSNFTLKVNYKKCQI